MPAFKPKIYIKDESFDPIYKSMDPPFYFKSRMLPAILMSLGVIILGTQVVIPLVFFKTQNKISKPVSSTVLGVASGFRDFEFFELKRKEKETNPLNGNAPQYFYLTVPKLKIENALVETNSKNLSPDSSLGHYLGSALPGGAGNTFVYGHSVLPWFYNSQNYKTIFSTLNDLTTGDFIYINYNNKEIKYVVESKELVDPEKVEPLTSYKPAYLNESTITLMTCWPAGTKSKRLMIHAVTSVATV